MNRGDAQNAAQWIWNARPRALQTFPQHLTREQWARVIKTGEGKARRWAVEVERYYERASDGKSASAGWMPLRLVFAATLDELITKFETLARNTKGWKL